MDTKLARNKLFKGKKMGWRGAGLVVTHDLCDFFAEPLTGAMDWHGGAVDVTDQAGHCRRLRVSSQIKR